MGEIPIRLKIEKGGSAGDSDLTGSAEIVVNTERNTLIARARGVRTKKAARWFSFKAPEGFITKKIEIGLPTFTTVAVRSGLQKGT